MEVMVVCRERSLRHSALFREERPLVPFARRARVDLVVEIGILDVDFFGVDAHDGAVLFMQFPDLPDVLTSQDHIVVEFVPVLLYETLALLC